MPHMTARVLIDNLSRDSLHKEWGLAIHIQYGDTAILLDTGATGIFTENADAMGIDLNQVDFGVLSHAHYDHADGLSAFFARNNHAPFYLQKAAEENCYGKRWIFRKYIGIRKGTLARYASRIRFASPCETVCPGVTLLAHSTPNLDKIGRENQLYARVDGRIRPDDFRHEQSLILDTDRGLVVFNSCSHGGADHILAEVAAAFPHRPICALVGGLHLYRTPDEQVRALAERMRRTGIETVVTGHCTGQHAYDLLRQELGDCVQQLYTGYTLEL